MPISFSNEKKPYNWKSPNWVFLMDDTRQNAINKIKQFLTNQELKWFNLIGFRAVGKSSVLFRALEELGGEITSNWVVTNHVEDINQFARELINILPNKFQNNILALINFETFDDFLKSYTYTQPDCLVVCLSLTENDSLDMFRIMFENYKIIVQMVEPQKQKFILETQQDLLEELKDYLKTILSNQTTSDSIQYIYPFQILPEGIGANENDRFNSDVKQEITKWAGGHPYLIQIVCYVYEQHYKGSMDTIDASDAILRCIKDSTTNNTVTKAVELILSCLTGEESGAITNNNLSPDIVESLRSKGLVYEEETQTQLVKLLQKPGQSQHKLASYLVRILVNNNSSTGFLCKHGQRKFIITCSHSIGNTQDQVKVLAVDGEELALREPWVAHQNLKNYVTSPSQEDITIIEIKPSISSKTVTYLSVSDFYCAQQIQSNCLVLGYPNETMLRSINQLVYGDHTCPFEADIVPLAGSNLSNQLKGYSGAIVWNNQGKPLGMVRLKNGNEIGVIPATQIVKLLKSKFNIT